jgi:hypothetical protein
MGRESSLAAVLQAFATAAFPHRLDPGNGHTHLRRFLVEQGYVFADHVVAEIGASELFRHVAFF